MGGSIDRIVVVPVKMTQKNAVALFGEVDVNNCKCFKDIDRTKLLSIVQEGNNFYAHSNLKFLHDSNQKFKILI